MFFTKTKTENIIMASKFDKNKIFEIQSKFEQSASINLASVSVSPVKKLIWYFNVSYYTLMFPFKLTFSSETSQITFKTNKFQKVRLLKCCNSFKNL